MKLLRTAVALATASLLLVGCEANKPSSASDNAVPASTAATVPLFEPLAQDATKIPFPVDLLFADSTNGNVAAPVDPGASNASVIQALNTSSGFSTTAMMTIPFSAPIQDDTANLMAGIRIFETNGNFPLSSGNPALTPSSATELTYGVDFVVSVSGNTLAILPLKPLASAISYIVVVTTSLKSTDGKSVAADAQYADARTGHLAPLASSLTPKILGQECLVAAAAAAGTSPLQVLKVTGSPCELAPFAGTQDDIALSYSVTTQNITAPIAQAQGQLAAPTIALTPASVDTILQGAIAAANAETPPDTAAATQLTTLKIGLQCVLSSPTACPAGGTPTPNPLADVYVGKIAGMTSFLNPTDPANSTWQGTNPLDPADKTLNAVNQYKPDPNPTLVDAPILVTVPKVGVTGGCAAVPAGGFPVTIYQHGITSDRATLLALGMSLAAACQVAVAIDLPEHGVRATGGNQLDQLLAGITSVIAATAGTPGDLTSFLAPERLVTMGAAPGGNCMTGAKVASLDGRPAVCPAGDSYINLFNLANARDVLRQSVVDLDSLYKAISGSASLGGASIDTGKISFVGMSLGSIVGETFVATLPSGSLTSAVFNVGGGGIAKLLDGSPTFEPVITDGLAAQGVTKPSADYESFLMIAQTLVDSADPINYADTLNTLKATTPILFQEVVGNGSNGTTIPSDGVVPNNVFGNSALGQAWGVVSGSGQNNWLWGMNSSTHVSTQQNTDTIPAALGGTDSLVQGTAFVSLAQAMQPAPDGVGLSTCPSSAKGVLCNLGMGAFFGIGLPQVGSQPTADGSAVAFFNGSGVVRFAGGEHGSLLNPDVDGNGSTSDLNGLVTTMMQTQVASFIGSVNAGGAAAATIVGVNACVPVIGAACSNTIADWTSPLQ